MSGGFFRGHSCPLAHFAVDTLDNCLQQWLEPRWMDGTRLHCPECMCACTTLHPFPTGNFLLPLFFFSSSATLWPCLSHVLQCIQRLQSGIMVRLFCDWCVTGTILRAADGSHLLLLIQCCSHTSRDSSVRVLNTKREQNEGLRQENSSFVVYPDKNLANLSDPVQSPK